MERVPFAKGFPIFPFALLSCGQSAPNATLDSLPEFQIWLTIKRKRLFWSGDLIHIT
jgi:hypothetical protein